MIVHPYASLIHSFFCCLLIVSVQNRGEIVVLEPLRSFKVLNSGVRKDDGYISIVPLELIESGLIYEGDIPPGVCRHLVKSLKENLESEPTVKKFLKVLCGLPFNAKCKQKYEQVIL